MTTTFNHVQIAPLIKQLEEAKTKSKTEERAALKLKLSNKLQEQSRREKNQFSRHFPASRRRSGQFLPRGKAESQWMDTSGSDALMMAARRGLIREHIAKVAIMKQLGMEDIPTFADVWQDYLERKYPNHSHETHSTTGNCGCGSSH